MKKKRKKRKRERNDSRVKTRKGSLDYKWELSMNHRKVKILKINDEPSTLLRSRRMANLSKVAEIFEKPVF